MLTDTNEALKGQKQSWNLVKKLGEGDAGEVYLVESILDKQPAILKRPRKGAFFSDTLRQASQIRNEGKILRWLRHLAFPKRALQLNIPALVDQNPAQYEQSAQTFIIISQAHGMDLKQLSQFIRFGSASLPETPAEATISSLLGQWSHFSAFPAPLLVRVLLGVLDLLETIHSSTVRTDQGNQPGLIWNDVKPEHLYWDPTQLCLTAIDWGNSQLLETDGITKDRHYSATDDYRQFCQDMGSFISEANPELRQRLEWPEEADSAEVYKQCIQPLEANLAVLYEADSARLQALRQQETDLYSLARLDLEHLSQYEQLQSQLADHGEMPDRFGALNFLSKAAFQMITGNRLEGFQAVCEQAARLPSATADKWQLLGNIATLAGQVDQTDEHSRTAFSNALSAGVADDWSAALWELFIHLGDAPRPDWWEKISQQVRNLALGLEPQSLPPYTIFARLYYTLRSEVTRLGEQRLNGSATGNSIQAQNGNGFHWQSADELVSTFREEIVNKWKEIEPSPPGSDIGYSAVDMLTQPLEALLPGTRPQLDRALAQPKAQVHLVLSAWEQKDFELARRGLRLVLLWDPDRVRLFTAWKALATAPDWLASLHRGAAKDEPFYDYLTSVELTGRTLRNQVGPASWLDEILEVLKRLRKGIRSVDLLIEFPEIMHELPWLNEYQSRELVSLPHTRPLTPERDDVAPSAADSTVGVLEGRFGPQQGMALAEPLDTWTPEARGSSARVFTGNLTGQSGKPIPLAFKIMRPDQLAYALPLFVEEVQILTLLRDVPGITPLVECGFIKLDDDQALPSDESHAPAGQLSGQVVHYGVEQAQNFLASMDRQLSLGWLPYLALVRRNPEYNLLHYCDASHTHGWFLPLRHSLILALQLCDLLQHAHDRNIVYRDHKILHYYWDPLSHSVTMIDWNIAKRQPQGLADADRQFDLVQFGARGLHHIFTGRPAQGSLPLGPNRPEEIEKASARYPVSWTYDDERLPNQLRLVLEQALNQGYTQLHDIRRDLLDIFQQLPATDQN
jgi:serine/threonine protein kinase